MVLGVDVIYAERANLFELKHVLFGSATHMRAMCSVPMLGPSFETLSISREAGGVAGDGGSDAATSCGGGPRMLRSGEKP